MKVTLEITKKSWAWSVFGKVEGKRRLIARWKIVKAPYGWESKTKVADFEKALSRHEGLLEAIENESIMDIAKALEGEE